MQSTFTCPHELKHLSGGVESRQLATTICLGVDPALPVIGGHVV